ncbi:MAG: hypothetical protein FD123_360 [Bacteroidetes bacterium]|nr:MAG: hypothetical protein FD123_360 [Bacteroidota bacterium]
MALSTPAYIPPASAKKVEVIEDVRFLKEPSSATSHYGNIIKNEECYKLIKAISEQTKNKQTVYKHRLFLQAIQSDGASERGIKDVPSKISISIANTVLDTLNSMGIEHEISVSPDGGLLFEMKYKDIYSAIEIDNEGQIGWLKDIGGETVECEDLTFNRLKEKLDIIPHGE